MLRGVLAAALMLAVAGCPAEHDPAVQEVESADCYLCHTPEYETAQEPPHVNNFSTACGQCHDTAAWQPWLGHDRVTIECVTCHRPDYDGTTDPMHEGTCPTTCDDCHRTTEWDGALGCGHPEASFPITSGPHRNIACQDCHDLDSGLPSTNGENTDCLRCHSLSKADEDHREEGGNYGSVRDPNNKHFCLASGCHPNGLKND